jgi:prepilin-type N-terminal cleavage/methylation domain-containing protein
VSGGRGITLPCRWCAGYTLIELTAVIVLLGLVAVMSAPRLAGSDDAAQLGKAVSLCRWMESLARMEAQRGRLILLEVESGAIVCRDARTGEERTRRECPRGVSLQLEAADSIDTIVFDARGMTADHQFRIQGSAGLRLLRVNGLTGDIGEESP